MLWRSASDFRPALRGGPRVSIVSGSVADRARSGLAGARRYCDYRRDHERRIRAACVHAHPPQAARHATDDRCAHRKQTGQHGRSGAQRARAWLMVLLTSARPRTAQKRR